MASHKSLFIFFFSASLLLAILVGILPFVLEIKLKSTSQLASTPHADNTQVWAKFPGKLNTTLNHVFSFFTMGEKEPELTPDNITVKENILYDNFVFDAKTDQITFDARREYGEKKDQPDNKLKTLSMGMLELFETISNYPIYQKGIFATNFLINQIFGTSDDFIRKLFTVSSKRDLMYDKDRIKETILRSFDEVKRNKIIDDKTYGLLTPGYAQWVKLIGKDKATIKKAKWLTEVLSLTDEEISLLLGEKSFLNRYFLIFNANLARDNKCPQNPCGNEIIFLQLKTQEITKSIGFQNIKQLNEFFDASAFPYEHSIEMSYYYNLIHPKASDNEASSYENITLSVVQLEKLLQEKSDGFILNTINAINLLEFNSTNNLYLAYNSFLTKSIDQMHFITNYFFDFLPKNILFGQFFLGEKEYILEPLSKAYISLVEIIINSTYGKLYKNYYFSKILYSLILAKRIKDTGVKNLCPRILQLAIGDQMRVRKICAMKEYNMADENGVKKWIHGFLCKIDDCEDGIFEEMKSTLVVTDEEINTIYESDYLGEYLIPIHNEVVAKYGCNKICSNEYLTHLQFTNCEITKNPPESIKEKATEYINKWDPSFPQPIEFPYYREKVQCLDTDCNKDSYKAILSLNLLSENYFSSENTQKLNNKILFERIHSLLLNKVEESAYAKNFGIQNAKNFFKLFDSMIETMIIKSQTIREYTSKEILYGSNKDNYLNIIRQGSPMENYKPTIEKIIGILPSKEEKVIPTSHTIQTSQNDKTQILRRLFKMNQTPFISINKLEYSMTQKEMIPIHTSLYNFYPINKDNWFNDGFQYDAKMKSIYYYDEISSRVLRFDYKQKKNIGKLFCYEFLLNKDITQGITENGDIKDTKIGQVAQKFNKPFVVSSVDALSNSIKTKLQSNDSTICVDPYSNMVVESNIFLVYSIHTKDFDVLNPSLKKNEMIPLIYYQRSFSIANQTTYDDLFEDVTSYFSWRLVLIIVGCSVISGLFALGVLFFIKYNKLYPRPNVNMSKNPLIPEDL